MSSLKSIFNELNNARHVNEHGVEFWDYFDLYHITYPVFRDPVSELPIHVFSCDGCPNFVDKGHPHYYLYYENPTYGTPGYQCGTSPVRSLLVCNKHFSDKLDSHIFYYPKINTVDFSTEKADWISLTNHEDLPDMGATVISAKLSRAAAYGLFNKLFVQKSGFTTIRLIDCIPTDKQQIFLLLYFMYPACDFSDLINHVAQVQRLGLRQINRDLEKKFSSAIYNACASRADFAAIHRAAYDTLFNELGRPVTPRNEPPANFYNLGLLMAVNSALGRIINSITTHRGPRLKKEDTLTLVKDEFGVTLQELKTQGLQPESMFCSHSVRQIQSEINRNERQFLGHYLRQGLSR